MRLYDWAMVIISYFLSFSYNRTMKIWKQKKKERMSLGFGLNLWWPNWLRRSLIIKRKGGACEERAGNNYSYFLKPRGEFTRKKKRIAAKEHWGSFIQFQFHAEGRGERTWLLLVGQFFIATIHAQGAELVGHSIE